MATWTDNCGDGGELRATPVLVGQDECSETYAYTFSVSDNCGNTTEEVVTVVREFDIVDNCETIYGYNSETANCFSEHGFNQWGWTNLIEENSGTTVFDLYSGAGQCNIDKGTLTGTATISYEDGYLTVEYNILDNYVLNEAHVYVGCDPVPSMPNGKETVAPGRYNFQPDLGGGVQNYTIGPIEATGDLYVIVHGVACQIFCECSDSSIINGDEGGNSFGGAQLNCSESSVNAQKEATIDNDSQRGITSAIRTFPVPFKETVNVEYDLDYTSDVSIQVFDMRGRHLRTYSDKAVTKGSVSELPIDFAMKANQMYILKVTTDRETFVQQIISSKK